jgi:ketosteroid isomerase-like protein
LFGTVSIAAATANAPAPVPAPPLPAAAMSAAECEVWKREYSFALSVEQADAAAFADHIQEEAVFQAGTPLPQRGRAAVVEAWAPIVTGEFPLRWHPGVVTIGGRDDIALSSGPAWVEQTDPAGATRYRLGSFVSIWVRDADGAWRVLFDRSAQPLREASADDVAKVRAALPKVCPRG